MSDPRTRLQRKFDAAHRFANFGNALVRLEVNGFRGHASTTIEFRSPVTAFCGPNGTGKTTLLQLAACAFRQGTRGFQLRDYFPSGQLDRHPFQPKAHLGVSVWHPDGRGRQYTLSRRASRWSDYRVRDERVVVLLGSGHFVPRAERKDFAFRNAGRLVVNTRVPCSSEVSSGVGRILGLHYDEIERARFSVSRRTDSLLTSSRMGIRYSEIHMGCGESRIHNMVETLESVTEKALILLEEPEIALHQGAQFRLGEYLIDLATRKGHQILLSTHSEHLLRALPQDSRIVLSRAAGGRIDILPGLTSAQAASLLTEGQDAALTVVVEDDVAAAVLTETLSAADEHLFAATRVVTAGYRDRAGGVVGGGESAIRAAMRALRNSGLRVAGVLDGDMAADPTAFIFCLPGAESPEREIFGSPLVHEFWLQTYSLDVSAFRASLVDVHHHEWFERLARRLCRSRELLVGEASRVYARSVSATAAPLIEQLRDAASRG